MCVQRQLSFDPGAGVPRGPFGKPHAARGRRLRGDRAHGGRTVPVLEFSLAEYTPELRGTAAARLPHDTVLLLDHISSLDISLVELLKRADAHAVPLLRARRLVAGCTTNIYGEAEVLAANPRARYFAWD